MGEQLAAGLVVLGRYFQFSINRGDYYLVSAVSGRWTEIKRCLDHGIMEIRYINIFTANTNILYILFYSCSCVYCRASTIQRS